MRPFELTDLVGVDVNLDVAMSFWEQSFHEPRWQPHPIQAKMVAAGRLGRKAAAATTTTPSAANIAPPTPRARPRHLSQRDPRSRTSSNGSRSPASRRPWSSRSRASRSHHARRPLARGQLLHALGKHVECLPRAAPGLVLGRSSASWSTRRTSRWARARRARTTSTRRSAWASTIRVGRSNGARRSAPVSSSRPSMRSTPSSARSATGSPHFFTQEPPPPGRVGAQASTRDQEGERMSANHRTRRSSRAGPRWRR